MVRTGLICLCIICGSRIGYTQLNYGVKLGMTYGQHFIVTADKVFDEGYEGFGASVGVLVDYQMKNHRLSSGLNAFFIHSIFNTTARFGFEDESTNFFFVEIPLIYSYECFKNVRLGGGISNAFLMESGIKLANQLDDRGQYPYYFGLVGQVEYDLTQNLSIAGSYKYLGLLQKEGEPYFIFPPIELDLTWRF